MLDTSSLPTDAAGKAAWLLEREEAIAAQVRTALRRIVGEAFEAFLNTLTAAGDVVALDSIPGAWMTYVADELLDELGETYLAGAATAWLGVDEPSEALARAWEPVVNHNAESYIVQATNRLAGVGDETWRLVRRKVETAIRDGLTNEELREQVQSVASFSEFRADTIARTETVGAYVQGDMAGARALGADGPVEKVWRATNDARTRPTHVEADDQVRRMGEAFVVGGVRMDAPHDPSAPAGEVVNCRCYVEFLYPGDTRPDGSLVPTDVDSPEVVSTAPTELPAPQATTVQPSPKLGLADTTHFSTAQAEGMGVELGAAYDRALDGTGYSWEWSEAPQVRGGSMWWTADIRDADGRKAGWMKRSMRNGHEGLEVHNHVFDLDRQHQGQGLAARIAQETEDVYRAEGVKTISLDANIDVGGYAWARQGFDWDWTAVPHDAASDMMLRLRRRMDDWPVAELGPLDDRTLAQVDALARRLDAGDVPTPYEFSVVGEHNPGIERSRKGDRQMWLGKRAMLHSSWSGRKPL